MLVTLRSAVEDLLAENLPAAREREARAFDDFAAACGSSIVLFGAGGLGRRCLTGLRQHGIDPLAFADNNSKLWNKYVDELMVLPPQDAARQFGKSAVFVVSIWGALGADRMSDREMHLRSLGCERVIPFGPLFWKYPEGVLPHYAADLPHKVFEQASDVLRGFDSWADERSKREYVAQLKWRLYFDFADLSAPARDEIYFPPGLFELHPDEVFVDCGAYDGDTLRAFIARSNSEFQQAFALEPDAMNFVHLLDTVDAMPDHIKARVAVTRAAVGKIEGRVKFSAEGAPSSFVGAGNVEVDSITLDRYLAETRPTFIKMDIEGAEPDALLGASRLIREASPLLAISCYHRQDHLWSIPLLIQSLNPDYTFYLRPHDLELWDLVCYAIPRSRLAASGAEM